MIRYALNCDAGHGFEAWFRSSADHDSQAAGGLIACPDCGSTGVEKALMAPNLGRAAEGESLLHAAAPEPAARPVVAPDSPMREMLATMRELRQKVLEHGENTGRRFPEEARRIHQGEAEPRGIYGEATPEEARALLEDGIEIAPMPILPEDFN